MFREVLISFFIICTSSVVASPFPQAQDISPNIFLEQETKKVLNDLAHLDMKSRDDLHQLIEKDIMPHVDSTFMAKWVVGRAPWIESTSEQRDDFIEQFMSLLVNSYANTLLIFKNKEIEFKPLKKKKLGKTAQVICLVSQVGTEPITVLFQMRIVEGHWKIFDVIVEGISLLKGLKAQFNEDVVNYGIVGVTERIKMSKYHLKGQEGE